MKEERYEDTYNAVYERPSQGVNERTSEVKMKEDNVNYEDKTERYPDNIKRNEIRKEESQKDEDNGITEHEKKVSDKSCAVTRNVKIHVLKSESGKKVDNNQEIIVKEEVFNEEVRE